jgi:hypothetical protein
MCKVDDNEEVAGPLKRLCPATKSPKNGGRVPKKPRMMPSKAARVRKPGSNCSSAPLAAVVPPPTIDHSIVAPVGSSVVVDSVPGIACAECASTDVIEDRIDEDTPEDRYCASCWAAFDGVETDLASDKINAGYNNDDEVVLTMEDDKPVVENCTCGLVPCLCVVEAPQEDEISEEEEDDDLSDEEDPCNCMMIPCICRHEELTFDKTSPGDEEATLANQKSTTASADLVKTNCYQARKAYHQPGLLLSASGEPEVRLVDSLSKVLKPHQVCWVTYFLLT